MSQKNFGVGLLTLIPAGTNPTPIGAGILQEVSLDFAQTIKELIGSQKVAVDAAQAELKITGKAKFAQIQAAALQAFLSGSTLTTGTVIGQINEVATIPNSGFTITVAQAANYVDNLRVYNASTGLEMTRVASGPATGQYAVNIATGVYTFASADAAKVVWLSYKYTSTGGYTVAYNNQLMGVGGTFALQLFDSYSSWNVGLQLNSIVLSKFSLGLKNTDYTMIDMDFQALQNTAGNIISVYSTE